MSEPTFTVAADGKSITCHKCGKTSHNANDVVFHYCGRCNFWHDGPDLLNPGTEMAFIQCSEAVARLIRRVMPDAEFFLTTFQKPEGGIEGVHKFGVSVMTNLKQDELLKLLKGIIEHAEAGDSSGVIVRTE
jgi:hypothetical protein